MSARQARQGHKFSITATAALAVLVFSGAALASSVITLHPGQSRTVGKYKVVCTTHALAKTSTRVVLHPGYRVKIGKAVMKCVKPIVAPPPPAPAPVPPGSRSNPFAVGAAGNAGNWTLTVNSVNFDAWSIVQATNEFNDPPPASSQDVMISFTATYNGTGSTTPWIDLGTSLSVVGASGVAEGPGTSCGVIPNDLDNVGDVFTGATFTANICWPVPSGDTSTLELYWSSDGSTAPWWSLH